ncbi:hypothetical protein VINE108274_23975 [Vibrio neptunius]
MVVILFGCNLEPLNRLIEIVMLFIKIALREKKHRLYIVLIRCFTEPKHHLFRVNILFF